MSTPIQKLIDDVKWEPVPPPSKAIAASGELYATHTGILTLGISKLKVTQLNDGTRVIDPDSLAKFFGLPSE